MKEQSQTIKKSKLTSVITTLVLILLAALASILILPRLLGYTPYVVLTGSMADSYSVGSLIYVEEVKPETISIGDPITFVYNQDGQVVTHRVVAVDRDQQVFQTKGDNNSSKDIAPVAFANLIGRPLFSLPLLGYLSVFLMTALGRMVAISLIVIVIVLLYVVPALSRKGFSSRTTRIER